MLDVGAGSGVVGLLVARDNPRVELHAVEKQDVFTFLAQKNAEINKIAYTLQQTEFQNYKDEQGFDYIVSNPPFYHEGASRSSDEMLHTARYNVHLPIDIFVNKAASLLRSQGHFIFCYDAQQFGLICAALDNAKLRVVDVQFVHSKRDRKASIVLVHARKNSKSLMKVWPPFFAFEGEDYSPEAAAIYTKARTHTLRCQI
jgi:tRNA1(Val) A37 N6-methylase TrmN6